MPVSFSRRVIAWQACSGRYDLPWQIDKTPYRVWVSEVMLQQTQAKTVIPYFERFIKRFPSVKALADADLDEVLQYWAGLGYYSRARYLHRAASIVVEQFNHQLPTDIETLIKLPGIGRSTAGAILSLCGEQRLPILDGNVKRILTRHNDIAGVPNQSAVNKQLWTLSERLLPKKEIAAYTQGLMDLGATVCTRTKPLCSDCPVSKDCKARIAGTIAQRPTRAPTKVKPVRTVTVLIATHDHSVLLQRRQQYGIWGGLLCFPELEPGKHAENWCQSHLGVIGHTQQWDKITHPLTHFTMHITPLHISLPKAPTRVMEQSSYVWCKISSQLAVPSPVKRLLAQINTME